MAKQYQIPKAGFLNDLEVGIKTLIPEVGIVTMFPSPPPVGGGGAQRLVNGGLIR
jgi:hypothetical protein